MHELRTSSLTLLGLCFVGACSSAGSEVETGRDPVVGSASSVETNTEVDGSSPNSESSQDPTPDSTTLSDDPASGAPNGGATPGPSASGGFWTLVRSDDSLYPRAEEWVYDEGARLVSSREIRSRRDIEPFYAVDTTLTYDGNRVLVVHDAQPEGLADVTAEYEFEAGRVVALTTTYDGEPTEVTTFEYDEMGRLTGSRQLNLPDTETVWALSWRAGDDPIELLRDGEVACVYSWRHTWLGTTCYTDGKASETYQPDAAGRLGLLKYEDTVRVYTYDDAGRLTRQQQGDWYSEIEYTADGKVAATREPTADEAYIYDELGLLREVQRRYGTDRVTTTFEYERVSDDTVIETETTPEHTVVRTYQHLSREPVGQPQIPSFWTLLRMDQPSRYVAPPDYSKVP